MVIKKREITKREAEIKLSRIKSRVAKNNFIRKMVREQGIYL